MLIVVGLTLYCLKVWHMCLHRRQLHCQQWHHAIADREVHSTSNQNVWTFKFRRVAQHWQCAMLLLHSSSNRRMSSCVGLLLLQGLPCKICILQ